jgi:hypothetical protein
MLHVGVILLPFSGVEKRCLKPTWTGVENIFCNCRKSYEFYKCHYNVVLRVPDNILYIYIRFFVVLLKAYHVTYKMFIITSK